MGDLIEQQKRERRKIELFKQILRHTIGIIYAVAELALGFRPDLKQ